MTRELAPDTLIDGRYKILSRLGSGGMADVYCAEDSQLGRRIAVKLLHRRFAEDEQFVERFRREAQSAAGLQHPNVVNVYDRGEWDGTYYIAMEFLEGRTLKQLIRDEAPLAPVRAIDLTLQILKAARAGHKRGIVHRDMKPHNAIVDADDRLKVTDFGIARAGASDMTETGSIMGTAQYLSPEQAQGHSVGPSSDLYSIGVVLYELLTGHVPFDSDSAVTIALRHVSEAPTPPSAYGVVPELDPVVLRALEKDPARRYADADDFIASLENARSWLTEAGRGEETAAFTAVGAATEGTRVATAPVAPYVPPPTGVYGAAAYEDPEPGRRRWPLIVAALLLLLAAGAAAFVLTRPEKVDVPKVVGLTQGQAASRLSDAGFEVDLVREENADVDAGIVFRQSPLGGTEADEGSTIQLIVSEGPGIATIPRVGGKGLRTARKEVRAAGFRVGIEREPSADVKAGRVIRTFPLEGQNAEKGSRVILVVSAGPEKVKLPELTGLTEEKAVQELTALGLEADITEEESEDETPGTVIEQDPAPDTEIAKGETVKLVVAKESAQVTVPNVIGDTATQAANRLTEAGLRVELDEVTTDDPAEDGRVVDQTPSPDKKVRRGSTVRIVEGVYEEPADDPGDQP